MRRVLNVESGLNDGIATPFVIGRHSGSRDSDGKVAEHGPAAAVAELALGVLDRRVPSAASVACW